MIITAHPQAHILPQNTLCTIVTYSFNQRLLFVFVELRVSRARACDLLVSMSLPKEVKGLSFFLSVTSKGKLVVKKKKKLCLLLA